MYFEYSTCGTFDRCSGHDGCVVFRNVGTNGSSDFGAGIRKFGTSQAHVDGATLKSDEPARMSNWVGMTAQMK